MKTFINGILSEWLKTRHSAASWLVICGGFFTPVIMIFIQVFYPEELSPSVNAPHYWETLFLHSWESMALILLPVGIILATSLIAQLEYKNNTWKQVLATPQSFLSVFVAKYVIVIVLLLQFFLLFTFAFILSGFLPHLINGTMDFPNEPFPWVKILKHSAVFFLTSLPLVAIQFMVSLRFRNFLVSIGVGLGMVVASMFAIQWKYGFLVPFAYTTKHYMSLTGRSNGANDGMIYLLSIAFFAVVSVLAYGIYYRRRENI